MSQPGGDVAASFADSLEHLVRAKDSLLVLAGVHTDSVARAHSQTDWISYGMNVVAALLGALVGGWLAWGAAAHVHKKAVDDADKRRTDDEDKRRKQMLERIRRTLNRVMELGLDLPSDNDFLDLGKRGAEMRVLWETFHAQSGDLYLVGDEALRAKIEQFMAGLHSTVAGTEAMLGFLREGLLAEVQGATGQAFSNLKNKYSQSSTLKSFSESLSLNVKAAHDLLEMLPD